MYNYRSTQLTSVVVSTVGLLYSRIMKVSRVHYEDNGWQRSVFMRDNISEGAFSLQQDKDMEASKSFFSHQAL